MSVFRKVFNSGDFGDEEDDDEGCLNDHARAVFIWVCTCVHEGWGYHDWLGGRGLDFISDLRPSGSSRQLPARAEQSRPNAPWGFTGEVTTAAGDTLSPNTFKQSAQMIAHTHAHRWEDKMYGGCKRRKNLQKWDCKMRRIKLQIAANGTNHH